jgi:DNA-binding transcriptional ArsR family regulator
MLSEWFNRLDESIDAGAAISTLWTQLQAIRAQAEAIEAQLRETQTRIAELEAQARSQGRGGQHKNCEEGAKKILELLFNLGGSLSIEEMARILGLTKSMAPYHAKTLEKARMIELVGADRAGVIYTLTNEGRAYTAKNKLL